MCSPKELVCPKCGSKILLTEDWPDDCHCGYSFVDEIFKRKASHSKSLEDIKSEEFEQKDITQDILSSFSFEERPEEEINLESLGL